MIPKHYKEKLFPQNYRPISLLPAISKIAERIINRRIEEHTEELNVILAEQFGFRKQQSTEDQALRLIKYIYEGFERNMVTGGVFLGVSKTFERVWHFIHVLHPRRQTSHRMGKKIAENLRRRHGSPIPIVTATNQE